MLAHQAVRRWLGVADSNLLVHLLTVAFLDPVRRDELNDCAQDMKAIPALKTSPIGNYPESLEALTEMLRPKAVAIRCTRADPLNIVSGSRTGGRVEINGES